MSPYLSKYALRLLIAEDVEAARIDCVDRLHRKFRNAQIDEAASWEEAKELIIKAYKLGLPYDCAVLDLQLPTGGIVSPNTSIPQLILDMFGRNRTWLIQWTAYPEDQAIKMFQDRNHIPQSGIVFEVISKRDVLAQPKMERFIERLIAEKSVGHWLEDPHFARMRQHAAAAVSARPGIDHPPVSLPGFIHALVDVWPLLENHRKREALDTFKGTDWEIEEAGDTARLKDKRRAQALQDAQENAQLFEEVISRQRKPHQER